MRVDNCIDIADLRLEAKRRLPRVAFDLIETASGDESAMHRNLRRLSEHLMVARVLRGVPARIQQTELFGRVYSSCFGVAPTGMIGILRRNIELMLADAARQINLPMVLSSASSERLETVVARAPDHVWAQLYASEDARITGSMVRHAQDAGAAALVWTVDIPVASQYVRLVRAGFAVPHSLGFADKLEALTHVGWMSEYLRGGMDRMRQWEAYLPEGAPVREAHRLFAAQRNASQTWKELEVLRRMWAGPLIVKGILHPGDAIRAAEMGVDGVIVSNHGGNTLDRAPASIDMLPGVVAAVGDKLTVMFDGGVRRGSDIVLARCLGAKFVFTGRATLYGAAAGGSAGALRAMAILKDGVDRTLGQLGCNSLEDLSLDFVQQ